MTKLIKTYEILLKDYTEFHKDRDRERFYYYICNFVINRTTIKESEKVDFLRHFQKQRPSADQYTEFYNNPLYVKDLTLSSWFRHLEGNVQIRIELIKAIIEKLKEESILINIE